MKVSVPSALRNGYHSDSTTSSSGNESFSSSSSYASTSKRPTRADGRAIPSTSRSSSKLTSREREGAPASTDDDDDEDDDYISDETTFIPQDEDRTPRKVIRRKTQLCECIECALLITINDKGDSTIHSDIKRSERGTRGSHARNAGSRATERPWSRLVEIRQAMSKDKQKGKDTEPEASCSEQLQRMLDEEVIPLTMDKAYLARLSGAEARAARSFRSDQGPRGASASRR
nr:uncharacterized protein CI109_006385 [Kwoniella shandongensis]KAA5525314.1 hypothetical protein CI109_006385 [Kwoniella shandongensis]